MTSPIVQPLQKQRRPLRSPSSSGVTHCFAPAAVASPIAPPQQQWRHPLLRPSSRGVTHRSAPAAVASPIAQPQQQWRHNFLAHARQRHAPRAPSRPNPSLPRSRAGLMPPSLPRARAARTRRPHAPLAPSGGRVGPPPLASSRTPRPTAAGKESG